MASVPYRLWSDQAPAPSPAKRTIVAKLKPAPQKARRHAPGARRSAAPVRDSALAALIDNARVRAVHPVFPDIATAHTSARRDDAPAIQRARGLVTIELARGEDPKKMARHLESAGEVEYAYVAAPRRMFLAKKGTKPDPMLSRQWGHSAVRIAQARGRAGFTDAARIVIAVADSGIDKAHPDLKGIVSEYRNFVTGESAKDFAGHGTHVTGIIAAALNNGVGISGLCAAKILALKVLPSQSDWDAASYYRALGYCIGRARVLNLSLGSPILDPGERDVIADLIDAGLVVVVAMGNDYEMGNPVAYPAALDGVCAVGASDQADRRGAFSNTGSHISLSAPGVGIVSTTPTYAYPHGVSDYDAFDGTSMAAPHVAAAAALVLAGNPDLTPAKVILKLQRSADRVAGMKKRPSTSFGWGRLNIEAALK